jgi:molybdopterin converting factor small subunit
MIKVTIYLFSTIRAIIGKKELSIKLPKGATVLDLKMELARSYPLAESALLSMLTSVNRVFSEDATELPDQAEVAFFPHVSGG